MLSTFPKLSPNFCHCTQHLSPEPQHFWLFLPWAPTYLCKCISTSTIYERLVPLTQLCQFSWILIRLLDPTLSLIFSEMYSPLCFIIVHPQWHTLPHELPYTLNDRALWTNSLITVLLYFIFFHSTMHTSSSANVMSDSSWWSDTSYAFLTKRW